MIDLDEYLYHIFYNNAKNTLFQKSWHFLQIYHCFSYFEIILFNQYIFVDLVKKLSIFEQNEKKALQYLKVITIFILAFQKDPHWMQFGLRNKMSVLEVALLYFNFICCKTRNGLTEQDTNSSCIRSKG